MTKRKIQLNVKEVAEARKLSDLALASLARVDVRVIRRMFENEWEHVYLTQLAKVAEALGCQIAELIEEEQS